MRWATYFLIATIANGAIAFGDEPSELRERLTSSLKSNLPKKSTSIKIEKDTIAIGFDASTNLTENLTKRGLRREMVKVLKALHESKVPYSNVMIGAEHQMVDKFGREKKELVVLLSFEKGTVDKINWKNELLLPDTIYEIADKSSIHPVFKD